MEPRDPNMESAVSSEYQRAPIISVEQMIPEIKPINIKGDLTVEELKERVNAFPTGIVQALYHEMGDGKLRYFFQDFEGEIVIDLGPGKSVWDHRIISAAKAKGYVGIEPFNYEDLAEDFERNGNSKRYQKFGAPVTAALVKQDALSFLRRLPDKSVSIFASGLDINVVTDPSYGRSVSREIERTLSQNGAYISNDSIFTLDEGNFIRSYPASEDEDSIYNLVKYKRIS